MLAHVERPWAAIAGWFTGRWARWVTVALWLALAGLVSVALPLITRMEASNPANLPTNASSVVAGRIQQAAFPSSQASPGLLVFYRRDGLKTRDYAAIARFLQQIERQRLPEQTGPVPWAGRPAGALSRGALAHGTTLVVPLRFHATANAATLAAIQRQLAQDLRNTTGHNLLAVSTASGHLSARLTGPTGIAIDTSGLMNSPAA